MEDSPNWHLLKYEDGSTFGPIPLSQLIEWAKSAQISPLDKVSCDGTIWSRAPTIPNLEMDWLVQPSQDAWYGPTTVEAIAEFLRNGELSVSSIAVNCKNNTEMKVVDVPGIAIQSAVDDVTPGRASTREYLRSRIRELEILLEQERRKRTQLEDDYAQLAAELASKS